MPGLARFVLRHRAIVAVFWLVALIAGAATSSTTVSRLTVDFSLPGQPGYETSKQILDTYGTAVDNGATIVTITAPGGIAAQQAKVDSVFAAIAAQLPTYRVVAPRATGTAPLVTKDGKTAYGMVVDKQFKSFTDKPSFTLLKPLIAAQAAATGLNIRTTGYTELSQGNTSDSTSNAPSLLTETLLGAAGALIVLVFVFASFLALLPLLIAMVSILSTFLCVLALSYLTDMSFVVQFLIALVGLGDRKSVV